MAKSGYTVTRSNYTLKKIHSNTSKGEVYERDFMTTNNLGGWDSGSIPNSENGFKMVYRDENIASREHHYGDFLTTENGATGWTLSNGASKSLTSESHVVLNSDNTTLLSYAYYGSCRQLIESGIRKIINNFPAELWSTTEKIDGINNWYILNNDFEIDIVTKKLDGEIEAEVNPLRYFYLSFNRYFVFINGISQGCINSWRVDEVTGDNRCLFDREIVLSCEYADVIKIRRYWINGKPVYLTGTANLEIKLGNSDIEAFFNSLDDFQKLLLNRDSKPKYTAVLDFPHETERGILTYKKSFTWPIVNGWNLDIGSYEYMRYVNSLLDLALFYDEHCTDNLWKNMTHDAIKNMDITYTNAATDEDSDDYNEGTTKVQGLLWAYGRQFDEIKRHADNIKSVNVVTYKKDGNVPDYFLSDELNLSGWEVSSVVSGLASNVSTSTLFSGESKTYTTIDANIIFLKNLKISSASILSKKGTRRGIEEMLGMFGYASDDFKGEGQGDYYMSEKIMVSTVKGEGTHVGEDEALSAETYNEYKSSMETDTPESTDYDTLQGLPAIIYYYKHNNEIKKTIIPWFKEVTELDGEPYFQMYGGWGKISSKYSETISYLNIVKDVNELKNISSKKLPQKKENIVYVQKVNDEDASHYFKQSGDTREWIPLTKSSPEVRELASIIEEYRGNNPHTGYGNYDDGEEYLNYYRELFHYAMNNDMFDDRAYDCSTSEIIPEISGQGFNLSAQTDNKKCHYFYNKERERNTNALGIRKLILNNDKYTYSDSSWSYITGSTGTVGKDVRGSDGESGNIRTIYTEPSIINVKNLTITFRTKCDNEKRYIEVSVMPYLMQMVPSTTILEIKYENIN